MVPNYAPDLPTRPALISYKCGRTRLTNALLFDDDNLSSRRLKETVVSLIRTDCPSTRVTGCEPGVPPPWFARRISVWQKRREGPRWVPSIWRQLAHTYSSESASRGPMQTHTLWSSACLARNLSWVTSQHLFCDFSYTRDLSAKLRWRANAFSRTQTHTRQLQTPGRASSISVAKKKAIYAPLHLWLLP